MKKFLVLALSLCMVLALCVCGYAEDEHDTNPNKVHADCVEGEWSYVLADGCSSFTCGGEWFIHLHCSVCGDIVWSENGTDTQKHEYDLVQGYDATCEGVEEPKTGLTDGSKCCHGIDITGPDGQIYELKCNVWEKAQEEIPVKPCTPAQWSGWEDIYVEYIRANGYFCDQVETFPAFCKWCGKELEGSISVELEHDWNTEKAVKPTCDQWGHVEYQWCEVCYAHKVGDQMFYFHPDDEIPEAFWKAIDIKPLEHKYPDGSSAYVNKNGSLGTCETPAYSDYKQCALCGDIQGQNWMDPTGHDFTIHVAAKPATCFEDGWYEYWACENDGCNAYTLHAVGKEDPRVHAWHADGYGVPVEPAINHNGFIRMKPGVAPTCTAEGNAAYQYCAKCGTVWYNGAEFATKEDALVTIPAHGHVDQPGYYPLVKWDPWDFELVKRKADASMLVDFWYNDYVDTIAWDKYEAWFKACEKLEWNYEKMVKNNLVSYPADCENDGYQLDQYCPWCGEVRVAAHVVPAIGHDYEITWRGYAPTCDDEGRSDVETCKNCGHVKGGDVINARGHVLTEVPGAMPTCTKDGAYDWAYCTREGCNHAEFYRVELILRQGSVATGFGVEYVDTIYTVDEKTKKVIPAVDPTIPAFEHGLVYPYANDDGSSPCIAPIARVESTCVITGLYEGGEYCTLCGVYTTDPVVEPMKPHSIVRFEDGLAPNCTEDGKMTIWFCETCGIAYEMTWDEEEGWIFAAPHFKWDTKKDVWEIKLPDSVIIPALGHVEAPNKYEAPTCTEVGVEADGTWCKVCGVTVKEPTEIPALGHDDLVLEYIAPTCTTIGWTEGAWCKRCGETDENGKPINPYKPQEEIPALGHEFGRVEPYRAPTCTKNGNKAGLGCSNEGCDAYIIYPTVIPATNHRVYDKDTDTYGESYLREVMAQEPLCEMAGWQYFVYCSNPKCDFVAGADDDILDGGMAMIYSVPFDAKGNVVTEKHYYYVDGEKYYFETPVIPEGLKVEGKGHDFNEYVDRKPTCTEDGVLTAKTCKVCGYNEPGEYRPALGHDPVSGAKAPTCYESGWDTDRVVCGREGCDYVFTVGTVLPKREHKEEHVDAIAPTCDEVGYTEGVRCTQEGCDYVVGCEEVPATGHSKGEWVIERHPQLPQNDPIYGGYGLEVLYCANPGCGEPLDQRTIEPLKKGMMGDANGDGAVNAVDALAILLYDARLLPASRIDLTLSDMNGDGIVNSVDSLMVLKTTV